MNRNNFILAALLTSLSVPALAAESEGDTGQEPRVVTREVREVRPFDATEIALVETFGAEKVSVTSARTAGPETAWSLNELEMEERDNLNALRLVKQELSDAVAIAEKAAAGQEGWSIEVWDGARCIGKIAAPANSTGQMVQARWRLNRIARMEAEEDAP